ncbi:unnamed protein product [Dovyalis caffra]|uniref:Uncharacterized protein n=1 Tax=Dovyalis caffra TaxID=77055 RepID=A0AAV1SIJ2_9ROSI|nr:unnamed protein product [Dovyalis caffra]
MDGRSSTSTSCSSSVRKDSKGHDKAIEFACSTCLFCVSCPLSIVSCCIKLPCKIGCKAAGQAKKRFTCCSPRGSVKKIYASYSSFSDMDDSNSLPSKVVPETGALDQLGHLDIDDSTLELSRIKLKLPAARRLQKAGVF